jgi:hypothetical protein
MLSDIPTKFCTTCQSVKLFHGGKVTKGSHRAWRCQACFEKRTVSIYMSKKTMEKMNLQAKYDEKRGANESQ